MSEGFFELNARLYDGYVADWPGEIAFYQRLAAEARDRGQGVLEVACGSGRVAVRLAQQGVRLTGLDLSENMLAVAREKSQGMTNVRWVQGDMRAFDLGEQFGLIIIPGHAFQNLNEADDQAACLACIRRHLLPGGRFVLHLDHQYLDWLGEISGAKAGVFEDGGEVTDPTTGERYRRLYSWAYAPSTQTATLVQAWAKLDADGQPVDRLESGPIRLHCVFRFEAEHMLRRTGFDIEAVYGDFEQGPLRDDSHEMVWVARNS